MRGHELSLYLPQDRRLALARGAALPERAEGTALFADISGFTPLTEALARALGPRRGIEELTAQINRVYDALIAGVERYGGSVVSFAGDAPLPTNMIEVLARRDEVVYSERVRSDLRIREMTDAYRSMINIILSGIDQVERWLNLAKRSQSLRQVGAETGDIQLVAVCMHAGQHVAQHRDAFAGVTSCDQGLAMKPVCHGLVGNEFVHDSVFLQAGRQPFDAGPVADPAEHRGGPAQGDAVHDQITRRRIVGHRARKFDRLIGESPQPQRSR